MALQADDEKVGKEIHGKAVDAVNYLLWDIDVLSALRNIAMSELIFRRAKLFPKEAMYEIMEEDEGLRKATEKINKYDIFTITHETLVDIYVQKAIEKISGFICRYPEWGYAEICKENEE